MVFNKLYSPEWKKNLRQAESRIPRRFPAMENGKQTFHLSVSLTFKAPWGRKMKHVHFRGTRADFRKLHWQGNLKSRKLPWPLFLIDNSSRKTPTTGWNVLGLEKSRGLFVSRSVPELGELASARFCRTIVSMPHTFFCSRSSTLSFCGLTGSPRYHPTVWTAKAGKTGTLERWRARIFAWELGRQLDMEIYGTQRETWQYFLAC